MPDNDGEATEAREHVNVYQLSDDDCLLIWVALGMLESAIEGISA